MNENLEQLHNKIIYLAKEHRKTEARLIDELQRAEETRLFLHRGHPSLFRYVCDELGFSEAMTSNLITVARKAKEIPQLKEEIRQGNLSVSKLRKVCPVIDEKNQGQWIKAAKTNSQKELELKVASVKTDHTPRSSIRAVAKDTVRLSLDMGEESRKKIERLKDLLSSKQGYDCSLQEVIDFALEAALDKHDPIRKSERAEKRKKRKNAAAENETSHNKEVKSVCRTTHAKPKRKALPKEIIHKIQARDRGRCTYVSPEGKRCEATRWLQYHHILAIARGGKDVLENLTTLCTAHHKRHHEEDRKKRKTVRRAEMAVKGGA